jgi:hypothetical protein
MSDSRPHTVTSYFNIFCVWLDVKNFEVINFQPEPIVFGWQVSHQNLWTNPILSSGSIELSLPPTLGLVCYEIENNPQRIPCFLSPVHSTLQIYAWLRCSVIINCSHKIILSYCVCVTFYFFFIYKCLCL